MWLRVWCCALVAMATAKYWKPTVYQKIRQSPKLEQFFGLLEANRPAKLNIQYGEMTVFAPTNEAFEWYSGGIPGDLVGYHMAWYAKQLKDLHTGPLATIMEENPPLWITRLEDDVFVNNARIIPESSNYVSEINNVPKKPQVLHVVDEVLDPVAKRSPLALRNPTAFDFLSRQQFWDLKGHKTELFLRKVVGNHKEDLFKADGGFTFFIPVDEGFTDYRMQMLDDNVIDGHIVPRRVLFTRPTSRELPFETLANGNFLYVVVRFSGVEGKLFIKSNTLVGDANHPAGEVVTEIIKANIPVKNGVVHLISRPLVVFDRRLTLFPFLPVLDKLSMDPTLNYTYTVGELTGFNKVFTTRTKKFTFFVPRDRAWRNLQTFLELNRTFFDQFALKYGRAILSRHMVVSDAAYTIEDLRKRSNVTDTADVNLATLGGVLRIGIGEGNGGYVIFWRNKIMRIHKANYQCTNGIIHIVDDVFMNEEDLPTKDSSEQPETNVFQILNMLMNFTL